MPSTLPSAGAATASRCRACQLQLCKSRSERPHAALSERPREEKDTAPASESAFTCSACSTVLIRSTDPTHPGWRAGR